MTPSTVSALASSRKTSWLRSSGGWFSGCRRCLMSGVGRSNSTKQWWTPPTIPVPPPASSGANTDRSTAAATSKSASAIPPRLARCRWTSLPSSARRMYQRMKRIQESGFRIRAKRRSTVSRVVSVELLLQRGDQSVEHPADLTRPAQEDIPNFGREEVQPRRDLDEGFDLHQRAVRDVEKMEVAPRAAPALPLGDVARHRHRAAPELARQPVELRLREGVAHPVALGDEFDGLLPDAQVTVRSDRFGHGGLPV